MEETSAAPILDNTERAGLPGDHRGICTFESRYSPGYRLVAAALIRYSKDASATVPRRWTGAQQMLASLRNNEVAELLH